MGLISTLPWRIGNLMLGCESARLEVGGNDWTVSAPMFRRWVLGQVFAKHIRLCGSMA